MENVLKIKEHHVVFRGKTNDKFHAVKSDTGSGTGRYIYILQNVYPTGHSDIR
jgi:hypothetical protein